jgi:hypothetical protein
MAINITGTSSKVLRIFYLLIKTKIYTLAKGNPEKKLKWAFKMYDIDSNGSVDRQEMLRIIEVRLNSLNKKQLVSSNPSGLKSRTSRSIARKEIVLTAFDRNHCWMYFNSNFYGDVPVNNSASPPPRARRVQDFWTRTRLIKVFGSGPATS